MARKNVFTGIIKSPFLPSFETFYITFYVKSNQQQSKSIVILYSCDKYYFGKFSLLIFWSILKYNFLVAICRKKGAALISLDE